MTTDINQLISSNIPWRQNEAKFETAFPQYELTVAVIDAPTPELVDEATNALVQKLSRQKDLFRSIQELKGGAFFAQNGFLFEATDKLADQLKMLTQAQRLLQVLAGDPSLRGVIQALQFGLLGVQGGRITLDNMTWPLTLGADAIEKVNAGQPGSFSWRELVQGHASTPNDLRRFLTIKPVLDFSELEPGQRSSDAIRKAAADLDFAGKYQARLRLTGPVPMADEEFATIKENAALNATVTIAIVLFILWMALRWARIIFAVFVCLVVGLSVTAALGMLMVGTLNLISVYFAVLFVGLGVDFGLQFSVRYRAERHDVDDLRQALLQAGRRAGAPADARGARHRGGFPVVPADGLQGRVRARPHRRRRHADRVLHQHHFAAVAADAAQTAARAGAARLRSPRAGRSLPRTPPHAGPRRHPARRCGRIAAAALAAVRFQSDEPAQRQGRVGRDLSRTEE